MFSKGTFQRYLFEISSTRKKVAETYTDLAGRISDEPTRGAIRGFVQDLEREDQLVAEIRKTLEAGA